MFTRVIMMLMVIMMMMIALDAASVFGPADKGDSQIKTKTYTDCLS